ncbi:MAG: enolase C-terminal domain-like protein, partial [Planctomycetota bacterium]
MRGQLRIAKHILTLGRAIPSATGGNLPRQERLYAEWRQEDGAVAYAEAAPHPIHGPPVADIAEGWERAAVHGEVPELCIADNEGRRSDRPLWAVRSWPAPPSEGHACLVTFGADSPAGLVQQVRTEGVGGAKIKLRGRADDFDLVRAVLEETDVVVSLDPNGSWSPREAKRFLYRLEPWADRVLWVEQPCRPDLMGIRLTDSIAVLADEAVGTPALDEGAYDGVVLKPARIGLAACAEFARTWGSQGRGGLVTLGCHLQSSLLTCATLQLAGWITVGWIDLDTAYLVGQ